MAIGQIAVAKQEFGIARSTTNKCDGVNSDLLGLAYPALTSAHPSNTCDNSSMTFLLDRLPYNPLLFTIAADGLIDPIF